MPELDLTVTTMRAIVQDRYGPLEQMRLAEQPVPAPTKGQVLVRVAAAGVDPSIWHLMTGIPYAARLAFGLRRPKYPTPGWDAAGVVVRVGPDVQDLRTGDHVFGAVSGSFAEYAVGRADRLVRMPDGVSFEHAAAVPTSGVTALQALRDKGKVAPEQRVAVLGAGGGVGVYAVQLAKLDGAEVTGVCSTAKLDVVRALGADHVVDYTDRDVLDRDERYDVIIDTAGNRPIGALRRILTPRGRLVIVGGEAGGRPIFGLGRNVRAAAVSAFVPQHLGAMLATTRHDDLTTLADHLDTGALTPRIDTVFPLDRAVEAVQYVQAGQATGKVVVTTSSKRVF